VQILTITFLLTICPYDCLENRHDSSQVFSEKAFWKIPSIATRQNAQSLKAACIRHFRAKQNHPPIKFFLSIDGRLFG
jgi:hypothetical protein